MPRTLRRFFIDAPFPSEGALFELSPRETHHLQRVLRLKAGDRCEIFNRTGQGARATIQSISEIGTVKLHLDKFFPFQERSLWLKVGQALPQKRKMDFLVDWASELGIQELWVMETKRTVVKMKGEARERARHRWERIAVEASKQSHNPLLTRIEGPLPFEKIVKEKMESSERAFLFHPDSKGLSFPEFVESVRHAQRGESLHSIFLFFGPEGGFSEEEVAMAESRGVQKVFLGDSIFRMEVAFLGVLGALRFLVS